MHNTEVLKGSNEGKKERKETLTGGENNFSQTDRYLYSSIDKKKIKVDYCNVPGISSSFHFVLVQSLCAATCLITIFSHHINSIKSQIPLNAHHFLKAHFNIM